MLTFLAVVYHLATLTHGENPAIKVTLTNKGLQYVKNTGADWIQEKLEGMFIPDISGQVRLGLLGRVHYTLMGMTVSHCDFPEPSVEFYEDETGFKLSISGLSVAVKGQWATKYGLIDDHGSFDLAVFDVDVTSIVGLWMEDGHPSVSSVYCDARVREATIQFYGGGSWIIQPFVQFFYDRIRRMIEEQICPSVKQRIDALEGHLGAMNVTFQLNQHLAVDLSLTSFPVMDDSSLTMPIRGECHSLKSPQTPPFTAQPFSPASQPGYMLSLGLSAYTANSASYAYYTAGWLQVLITDDMLPILFPDCAMQLRVYASEAPEFRFRPDALELGLVGAVKAFAVKDNATLAPLFVLNVDSTFTGKVWVASGKLKGSVAMKNLTLTLASSEVGSVKTAALEVLTKLGIKLSALARINEKLGHGFDLPKTEQAKLTNAVLKVEEGFIAVRSDAEVRWTFPMRDYIFGSS